MPEGPPGDRIVAHASMTDGDRHDVGRRRQ
jgi:hypothetical protein